VSANIDIAGEDRIGGFRFIRTIHPGATSMVMEVVQESTQKRFAMKQLLPTRAQDPDERRQFEFEAKLGMKLRHPKLLRVHEYFRDPVQPYFIMDFFPSIHLRLPIARPSKYEMPKRQLHSIISQAASALSYMHEQGWIHRDVKPENILLSKAGEVRVVDYALAMRPFGGLKKLLGGKAPRQGTPSYMSPEQIRCESPAPSADIYSFGITCYELACGRQPFRANSASDLLKKHLSERPTPLAAHNKDVTPEFADLVMRMIQKSPAMRPASMMEFLTQFSRIRIFKDDPDPSTERGDLSM